MKVTATHTRKSVATLLRQFADTNGVSYEARYVKDKGGRLAYFVADREVTRDEIMTIMDTGQVDLSLA